MSIDWEKEHEDKSRKREKQQQLRRAQFSAMCEELEQALHAPDTDQNALERQADLLDTLLYTMMRSALHNDKKDGSFNTQYLDLALRIQKQCTDTLKASVAAEYMGSLTRPKTVSPPPHPLKISKRTEDP